MGLPACFCGAEGRGAGQGWGCCCLFVIVELFCLFCFLLFLSLIFHYFMFYSSFYAFYSWIVVNIERFLVLKMIFRQRIRDNFTAPPTACINKMVMGRLPWGGGSASPTACINKMVAGERDGEWGKQVGSMNEESQVSGCCNITFNYTNQETV